MGKLVGTSAIYYATRFPCQRKTFYAAGRFWVPYSDGTNMVYKTSTDGVKWAGPTIIRQCISGTFFSIWFDEILSFLHYAYSSQGSNTPIYYRRGTPESDGTITWSGGEEQAVVGAVGVLYFNPNVSVDSNGYPWIGYSRTDITGHYPYATRSDNNAVPIWSGAEVPDPLSVVSLRHLVSIIPLTGGEILAIYASQDRQVRARLWNGAWGNEVATTNICPQRYFFCAVAEGNDVHLVFMNTSYRLIYAKYDYSSNSFTAEKILLTGIYIRAPPAISIDGDNNLLVFWGGYPEANTLYYLKYTAETGTWGPAVKWKTEEKLHRYSLTCFYKQYNGYTGLAYTTNPSPGPYAVKFNYIAPEILPEPEVVSNTLTAGGSRHTTPEQGSVGTFLSARRTRIVRHITWVPVIVVRA